MSKISFFSRNKLSACSNDNIFQSETFIGQIPQELEYINPFFPTVVYRFQTAVEMLLMSSECLKLNKTLDTNQEFKSGYF